MVIVVIFFEYDDKCEYGSMFKYRKMEYFRVAKFSRFGLNNMRINIRVFLFSRSVHVVPAKIKTAS